MGTPKQTWVADAKAISLDPSGLFVIQGISVWKALQELDAAIAAGGGGGGVPPDLTGINTSISGLQTDVSDLQTDVSGIQTDVSGLQTGLSGLQTDTQGDISGLQTSLTGTQDDVSSLQTGLTSTQSDVSGLQTDVSGLQTDVSGLQTDVTDLEASVANAMMQEVGYAENNTTATLALSTTITDIDALIFALPQINRPQWLMGKFMVDVTTAPAASNSGTVIGAIQDDAGNTLDMTIGTIEGAAGTAGYVTVVCWARVAANTPARTYRLSAQKGANASFAGVVMNGSVPGTASKLVAFRT